MSAQAAIAVRTWKAGAYTCQLTMQRPKPGATVSCVVEWSPEQPKRLSETEMQQYRAGRNSALADISRELGINAAVIDL